MKVKVAECNTCNGPIRWRIFTSIQVIIEPFALAFIVLEISNFVTLKMYFNITMYNIRKNTIRLQMHDFLPVGNSDVCSFTIYEIFKCQIKL